jgi:hypothetical protein
MVIGMSNSTVFAFMVINSNPEINKVMQWPIVKAVTNPRIFFQSLKE